MKSRIPISYLNLPKHEKEAISKMVEEEVNRILNEEEVTLFTQYTKMLCIVLHDYFGFGEKRLTRVIGNFRMLHRKFRKVKTAKEVNEALEKEMRRIFKKGGFPQEYVESLQRDN
jgi:hypothetical protein